MDSVLKGSVEVKSLTRIRKFEVSAEMASVREGGAAFLLLIDAVSGVIEAV
jgi:hypothetical protein